MDRIYDTECFPNFWCLVAIFEETDDIYMFEISSRRNDVVRLLEFFEWLKINSHRMVGFNSLGYDYPMIHNMMNATLIELQEGENIARFMFQKNQQLFATSWKNRFQNIIPAYKQLIPQLDLYKIHHFDKQAGATGLKVLEINMRSKDVRDLPFPPGTMLTHDQMQITLDYCIHDVRETQKFYKLSLKMIQFRDELTLKHGRDYTNHNNTKIGKDFLISELEKQIGPEVCFSKNPRRPKQTIRGSLRLADIIFPYIGFRQTEFNRILSWMKDTIITETKEVFDNVSCMINGFTYDFGTGGIHGSVDPVHVSSDQHFALIDLDVTSYYPSLAIVNRLYPAHLSEKFCDIYADLKTQRQSFDKGTPENAMLKLALNGIYGASNDKYSPFYDPAFTMSITINGQLLLCMLVDWLLRIPDLTVIQINTDGLTIKVPHSMTPMVDNVKSRWQKFTCLGLEQINYSDMWIRDVNNYIAMDFVGKAKRKGVYEYDREWHQNHSMLVIRKAAEAHLVRGANIREFIMNHDDNLDFCLTAKVPRTSRLMWGNTQVQGVSRYYICMNPTMTSLAGVTPLIKVMPPLAKNPTKERPIGINVGWNTSLANDGVVDRGNVNYDFYVQETEKLTKPITGG